VVVSEDRQNFFSIEDYMLAQQEYIVMFESSTSIISTMDATDVESLASEIVTNYELERKQTYFHGIYGFTASNFTKQDISKLRVESRVLLVEKDTTVELDSFENGFDMKGSGIETLPVGRDKNRRLLRNRRIQAVYSPEIIPQGVEAVGWKNVENNRIIMNKRVFIVDSGVAKLYRELNIDRNLAANFVTGERISQWVDCNGHGTHIAGIIAAKKNGIGVVGVAAGAMIVPLRALDCNGNGQISSIIKAIEYVSEYAWPGDVVNLSIGGITASEALDIAVRKAAVYTGASFVIAAGNSRKPSILFSPARVDARNIHTVCASEFSGDTQRFASFSNYGRPPIDVCAPGSNILSLSKDGGFKRKSGTSMAAPHVSGALIIDPNLRTRDQIYKNGQAYPLVTNR